MFCFVVICIWSVWSRSGCGRKRKSLSCFISVLWKLWLVDIKYGDCYDPPNRQTLLCSHTRYTNMWSKYWTIIKLLKSWKSGQVCHFHPNLSYFFRLRREFFICNLFSFAWLTINSNLGLKDFKQLVCQLQTRCQNGDHSSQKDPSTN